MWTNFMIIICEGFTKGFAARDDQYVWVASIIAEGQPLQAIIKGDISCHDLNFEAGMWLDLVFTHLIPFKNTIHVSIEVAILIVCIMASIHINMGEIIADEHSQSHPPTIRYAIKLAMKTMVEMIGSLCARVNVLESEVASLRKEMDKWKAMVLPMGIDLNLPIVASDSHVMDKSPQMIDVLGSARQEVQQLRKFKIKSNLMMR
ncbi:hypothetical protein HAX54_049973 [Datura stramonium]|uniref:Uncharacterized protein n=1 Tax=Datura stramonium TaxID=4076 RepID=A0ABS8SVP9_DATST|nr:hypothetical protein [Datura stramonium]